MSEKVAQPQTPQKMTKSEQWFLSNVKDNPKEIAEVCRMTAKSMYEQAALKFSNPNSTAALYAKIVDRTFTATINFLVRMQAKHPRFSVVFGNNFNIGYEDDKDEEGEKVGNFVPVLEYGIQNKSIVPASGISADEIAINSYKRWLELNVKRCEEETKQIASDAFDMLLNQDRINLRYQESIVPIFCTFIDMLVEVLKFKYQEKKGSSSDADRVGIKVFGLFEAFYWVDPEDKSEVIEFVPDIKLKQDLKSDKFAGGTDK